MEGASVWHVSLLAAQELQVHELCVNCENGAGREKQNLPQWPPGELHPQSCLKNSHVSHFLFTAGVHWEAK